VVLDLIFKDTDTLAHQSPTAADLAAVTAAGGELLYTFGLRAVRVKLLASRVPQLKRNVDAAFYVPDPRRHDLRVIVTYTAPPTEADEGQLQQLSGRVLGQVQGWNALVALLPDRAIRQLWTLPKVRRIAPDGLVCGA
jgi:hypothetical protein